MEVKTATVKITRTIFGSAAIFCNQQVVFVDALPTVNIRTNVLYAFSGTLQSWTGLAWVTYTGGSSTVTWDDVQDKPSTFTPSVHTQAIETITDLQNALDEKVDKVTGKQLSTEDYTTAEKSKLASVVIPTYQTITIAVADWSGGTTCTKSVTGVTATTWNVFAFAESYREKIIEFDVRPSGQGAGTITFTADSTPDAEIIFIVQIKPV